MFIVVGAINFLTLEGQLSWETTNWQGKAMIRLCRCAARSELSLTIPMTNQVYLWLGLFVEMITILGKSLDVPDTNLALAWRDMACRPFALNFSNIMMFQIPERYGAVRMISRGHGNMLLVGTVRNCILQGTMDLNFSPAVEVYLHALILNSCTKESYSAILVLRILHQIMIICHWYKTRGTMFKSLKNTSS